MDPALAIVHTSCRPRHGRLLVRGERQAIRLRLWYRSADLRTEQTTVHLQDPAARRGNSSGVRCSQTVQAHLIGMLLFCFYLVLLETSCVQAIVLAEGVWLVSMKLTFIRAFLSRRRRRTGAR